MANKLYVFGNIGKLSVHPKSGGQSSARRVIKGLEQQGIKIVPIVRHRAEWEGKFLHQLETKLFAFLDLCKIIGHLLFGRRSSSAFLHLTYGGNLAPFEYSVSKFVRLLGYKSLTYVKGGKFVECYEKGSDRYKQLVKANMDIQSQVWFEGMPSLELVQQISNTHVVYFPNYVFEDTIAVRLSERPDDRINLLYFGRISPDKNVHVILDTFSILCEQGVNAYLTIIGGAGPKKEYVEKVDKMIKGSPYCNRIFREGLSSFDHIKEVMQTQHFYLFPTTTPAEGHSNALNECMSQGVVPIASDWHFNKSVVGFEELIIEGLNPADYADAILKIWTNKKFDKLSVAVWKRVKDNYTYGKVNSSICREIQAL